MYIVSSSVNISESEFQNNRADYGGGAIFASSSTVSIERSQFNYNTLGYSGSNIGGRAVRASSSGITINGSVFTYNNIYGKGGAILYLYTSRYSGILQVIDTMFIYWQQSL